MVKISCRSGSGENSGEGRKNHLDCPIKGSLNFTFVKRSADWAMKLDAIRMADTAARNHKSCIESTARETRH